MPDFSACRLFIDAPLVQGAALPLSREHFNYLVNVLRLSEGEGVLVFNGRDGEWQANLTLPTRKSGVLVVDACVRVQTQPSDLHYLFAPLKHARLDYLVQKGVEMGASLLRPVLTRRTQSPRLNEERAKANMIEAAEQCGILSLPEWGETIKLDALLADWPQDRLLVFCDENARTSQPLEALAMMKDFTRFGVLIGPEGGFDPAERATILKVRSHLALPLGPRILRADTAAVAALALVQASLGDWRNQPPAQD